MKAPRGLIGGAWLLWGFSTGMPITGAVFAAVLEILRLVRPSPISPARAPLVFRATFLAAIALLGYLAATTPMPQGLYLWLRWLPVGLVALALWPAPWSAVAYAAVVLVASGTGAGLPQGWFYPAAAVLVSWAVLVNKPWRGISLVPSLMLALAAAAGFGIQEGLSALQGQVEEMSTDILQGYFAPRPDPFKERTRVGDLGRVKLSDRIAMRVAVEGPRPAALLLREAAFDRYASGEWRTSQTTFRPVAREEGVWKIRAGGGAHKLVARASIAGGEGLLALPAGSRSVAHLDAQALEALPTGAVRARGSPRFVSMEVAYDDAEDAPAPGTNDLEVPAVLEDPLDRILANGHLVKATAPQTRAAIERFFDEDFSYSLALSGADNRVRTLPDFLLRDRKGHCEYFATATTLLLRRAGIPARYTVGYSAQEYNDREHAFIVRSRHAHAWVTAFLDGRWTVVDTTPARWAEDEEAAARGAFDPLLDWMSWMADLAVQAWIRDPARVVAVAGLAAAALIAAVLGTVVLRKRRRREKAAPVRNPVSLAWLGLERRLASAGFPRARGETALAWAHRLHRDSPAQPWRAELVDLALTYYRARFDPAARDDDRRAFADAARGWKGAK